MVNTSVREIAGVIGNQKKEVNEIKEEGFDNEQSSTYQAVSEDYCELLNTTSHVYIRSIGSMFILDSATNGLLDDGGSLLDGSNSFILSHAQEGRLGYNQLGGLGRPEKELRFVVQSNNEHIERFGTDLLNDTSVTSATVDHSLFKCTFADDIEQIYQTKSIFYDSEDEIKVSEVTILAKGDGTKNAGYFVSVDGGLNWTQVALNTTITTLQGNDLRVKVTNDQGKFTWPTPFGTWGGDDAEFLSLTELRIIYKIPAPVNSGRGFHTTG